MIAGPAASARERGPYLRQGNRNGPRSWGRRPERGVCGWLEQPEHSTILGWARLVARAARAARVARVPSLVARVARVGEPGGAVADPARGGSWRAARATRRPACEVGQSPCAARCFRLTSDPYI
jgi:hypothetical protein